MKAETAGEARTEARLLSVPAGTLLAAADARLLKALAGGGGGGSVVLNRVAEGEGVTVAFVRGRLTDPSFRARYRLAVDAAETARRRAGLRSVR